MSIRRGLLVMVRFKVEEGKKKPGDRVLRIWADGEVLSYRDLFEILKFCFENEDVLYPRDQGFKGRFFLLQAIQDLCYGADVEEVMRRYIYAPKARRRAALPIRHFKILKITLYAPWLKRWVENK